jgi:tetratricopeptide (TPR) repeat protein
VSPGLSDAEELRKEIEAEQQNASKLEALQHSLDAKEYAAVMAAADSIPFRSAYRERAAALEKEARTRLITQHMTMGEKRRSEGNCAEARREAQAVLAVAPEYQPAQDLINRCGRGASPGKPSVVSVSGRPAPAARPQAPASAVASAATSTPRPAARPAPTSSAQEGGGGGASSGPDPDDLMQQAQEAWVKGQFSVAIEASRKALRARPGLTRAYQIIAVCSCSLRDAEQATRAYERLDDRNRQMVKQLCAARGVNIE